MIRLNFGQTGSSRRIWPIDMAQLLEIVLLNIRVLSIFNRKSAADRC